MKTIHPFGRVTGFTLVELLVVISIVAVMMSLLMPALSTSRELAKMVKCQSNLRQTYMGFANYAEANKTYWITGGYNHNILWSRLVMATLGLKYTGEQGASIGAFAWNDGAGDQGYGSPSMYQYSLTSKARNNLIMKCPTENFLNNWGGENATSYRFNTGYTYGYGLGISDSYTVSPTYKNVWGRIKEHQLEKPSATFVIGEALSANGDYEYSITNFNTVALTSTYHNDGGNFLYTDGHAGHMLKINVTTAMFDRRR